MIRSRLPYSFGMTALLGVALGCALPTAFSDPTPQTVPAVTETVPVQWIKSELYFGLSRPNGGSVSSREWQRFLAEEVTPRFPDGLTVVDGSGQWRGSGGAITREKSKVLILLHERNRKAELDIKTFIDIYKKRFSQESVLWVTAPVDVKF